MPVVMRMLYNALLNSSAEQFLFPFQIAFLTRCLEKTSTRRTTGGHKHSCRPKTLQLEESHPGRVWRLQVNMSNLQINFCTNFRRREWEELNQLFLWSGMVRNISPQLWQFEHLTSLYLNDNCLSRLPSDIGLLVNLRTLDLSNNKLRSLPAELGELIQLRWVVTASGMNCPDLMLISSCSELHLSHNLLRNLPYELGKLFHLVVLGLHGNPLTKDILSIYNDLNGTNKLLTHMLDNYSRE